LLERATAYWHLGRFEEGVAVLSQVRYPMERRGELLFWRARCLEGLGRWDEAERCYTECNEIVELAIYKWGYAKFLAGRGRWDEARSWIDRAVLKAPEDGAALRLRSELTMMRLRADVKFGKTGVGRRARGMVRGAIDRLRARRFGYGTERT
jgi:tetratricopeptide (TPR) repeat protein